MAVDPYDIGGDTAAGGDTTDQTGQPLGRHRPRTSGLNIPTNILDDIYSAAGGDEDFVAVLAAVLYRYSKWQGLTEDAVYEVADAISSNFEEPGRFGGTRTGPGGGSRRQAWIDAASSYAFPGKEDSQNATNLRTFIDEYTGRALTPKELQGRGLYGKYTYRESDWAIAPEHAYATRGQRRARFPGGLGGGVDDGGLSAAATRSERRWIYDIYKAYWLREPTPGEYSMVMSGNWSEERLIERLRAEAYPGAARRTWGDAYDLRTLMRKWANEFGVPFDEGLLNWAMVNNIPINTDHISALYEQAKNHTVWGADPQAYRTTRAQIQKLLAQNGVVLNEEQISNELVNRAAQGKWSIEQMLEGVRGMQMPGYAPGSTIGQVNDVRQLAESWWDTYFPGHHLDDAMLKNMLGMSPADMLNYMRALPANLYDKSLPSIGVGAYHDTKTSAEQMLKQLGILGVTPTNEELQLFTSGKYDSEAIANYFKNRPDLVAQQPGLPYGLSREEYWKERSDVEKAYGQLFETPSDLREVTGRAEAGGGAPGSVAEPDWVKQVFKEGLSAQESRQMFGDYFQRLGRAPSIPEVRAFKTRHQATYRGELAGVGTRESDVGPTAPGLAGPSQNVSMGRRR